MPNTTPPGTLRLILIIVFVALSISLTTSIALFVSNSNQNDNNTNTICDVRDKLDGLLKKDAALRRNQASNSSTYVTASQTFIDDTKTLIRVFNKSSNAGAIAPITLYLQDQVNLQQAQHDTSEANIKLSKDFADELTKLRNNFHC